ncbi:hypothetical protein [Pedobacter mendelii]|uniref:DUF4239 domain-containing protein n=1 Tax=Pedobacter mendelii TaxID=1908240 RepID=A0ABQ2BHP7_9SPHI|nr:hypothetical protein [Pedobacter mendelii]GGI24571.1 hypothetical protein GCM10008119_13320 [Pedobacter mendelii]
MINNVAFDVVIGLIFIYLLYSLLATVVAEIIATKLGLRARNLKEAVNRMLTDEDDFRLKGRWYDFLGKWFLEKIQRIGDSLRLMKNPKNKIIDRFYSNPEIKYLGSSGLFKYPSSFKAVSFSKTLLYLLNGNTPLNVSNIDSTLRNDAQKVLGKETAEYVLNIWEDSEKNIVKFKMQLEAWFDRTMEQATEWYKRKIQIVLLIIGFVMAWLFNADSISIVHKLSKDKNAREQIVLLTSSYLKSNPKKPEDISTSLTANEAKEYKQNLDSLINVKETIEADIESTKTLLGYGSWPPDSVEVYKRSNQIKFKPQLDASILSVAQKINAQTGKSLKFNTSDKWKYFFGIFAKHFWGFLITAIAISLGAPFWFDLLNKLMSLRTSNKEQTESTNTNKNNVVKPSESN